MEFLDPSFHMWYVFGLTLFSIWAFASEKLSIEVTCFSILTGLLLFGQFFALDDPNGRNTLDSYHLLAGFANPSLIAVLALLVMGQGMIQTDALRPISRFFLTDNRTWAWVSFFFILVFTMIVSAFLNNTPVVIIAIPILQQLAKSLGVCESRVMMPLSYAAILGGMTTLIGSSTNLLVSSSMVELGYDELNLLDFWVPGGIFACVGLVYVVVVLPRLLPDRSSLTQQLMNSKGAEKEFVAELDIAPDSVLIGMECQDGKFVNLSDLNVKLIQRSGHLILPPFEGYQIEANDIMIVSSTRSGLTELLAKFPGFLLEDDGDKLASLSEDEEKTSDMEIIAKQSRVLAEVMISPNSRLVEMSLEQAGLGRYGAVVLGIQRRARVVRRRLGRIRLEAGDVLLIAGSHNSIEGLRGSQDLIVLSGSKVELPVLKKAKIASIIFVLTIGSAAAGILSIPAAAITGAALMIATQCLNIRQATRSIDRKIFLLVGTMLALGAALDATRGTQFMAEQFLRLPFENMPIVFASLLFIIVAFLTNVLSNNACAILFTPVALNMALDLGQDPFFFALTIIFAANCSFASPIGYKTNLLVMGPGNYRYRDFMRAGIPLVLVMWVAYIALAQWYFKVEGGEEFIEAVMSLFSMK